MKYYTIFIEKEICWRWISHETVSKRRWLGQCRGSKHIQWWSTFSTHKKYEIWKGNKQTNVIPHNNCNISFYFSQLSQGCLVKVSPSLIRRQKTHFHNLPCGASIIMGNNGFVWICPTLHEDAAGGFVQNLEVCWLTRDSVNLVNKIYYLHRLFRSPIDKLSVG